MRFLSLLSVLSIILATRPTMGVFQPKSKEVARRDIGDEYLIILQSEPVTPQDNEEDYKTNKAYIHQLSQRVEDSGGQLMTTYLHAFVGIHARLLQQQVLELRQDPRVKLIEPNGKARLYRKTLAANAWGIDRIDQRDLPLDNLYDIPYRGKNSHIYIVDTGLRSTHQEFTGRIGRGFSALPDDRTTQDCNGHGTHVSGTAMGSSVGVATQAMVHPVRVFNCEGSTTWDVIAKALDWIIENHENPAVVNMSLGGPRSEAIDTAVRNTVAAGISVVVAAGNANKDACESSPAAEPSAITVAASDKDDNRAVFSNWGLCVDIIAPGVGINSAAINSDRGYQTLSGTSMAAPHVAGAVALVGELMPQNTPEKIASFLTDKASMDKISDPRNTPNRLLYVKSLSTGPIVDAGDDIVRRFPNSSVTLIGKAKDSDGYIVSTEWRQLTGPTVHESQLSFEWEQRLLLKDLPIGLYEFRFTAQDNAGNVVFDDVMVTINPENTKPVADAGSDQNLNLEDALTLDGRKSFDTDGEIVGYLWEKITGPDAGDIVDAEAQLTEVKNFVGGRYVFQLTVKDNDGLTSVDTVVYTINKPPVVDAGDDQEIYLPNNQITLTSQASDPEGGVLSYGWEKMSGPEQGRILSPNELTTQVVDLVQGVYVFRFYALDNRGALSFDDMQVTVIGGNQPPLVDAGDDIVLILPENSVIIKGTCEDRDGVCTHVEWRFVRGTGQLTSPLPFALKQIASELRVSGLVQGTYVFEIVGTDNEGAVSRDQVQIDVREP